MRKLYTIYFASLCLELVLSFFAGPYSCEGGLTVYFYYGIFVLLLTALLAYRQKDWTPAKRLAVGFLLCLVSAAVWFLILMSGEFQVLCKLF